MMQCIFSQLNLAQNQNNSTVARRIPLDARFRAQGDDAALLGAARPGKALEAQRLKSEPDLGSHGQPHSVKRP